MVAPRQALAALATGTALFGAAIALRDRLNPWWTNAGTALLVIVWSAHLLRDELRSLLRPSPRALVAAIVVGFALVAATHLVFWALGPALPVFERAVAEHYREVARIAPPRALVVPLIVFIVVAEELLWRGVALSLCRRRLAPAAAVAASVVLYVLPQLIGGSWLLMLAALGVGSVFAVARVSSRQLVSPIVTHAIWSVAVFEVVPLMGG